MKKPTTSLMLDIRYKSVSKVYPVRLRVTNDGERYYFKTSKSMTEEEWSKMNGKKPGEELKNILTELNDLEKEMRTIISTMPRFSIEDLRERFKNKEQFLADAGTLESAFKQYEAIQWGREKAKTAYNYKNARISFEKFRPKMFLTDITADLLRDYQFWMVTKEKKSLTTVSMYARSLRAVINKALIEGKFPEEKKYYPFGKHKYKIPSPRNRKNPLSTEHLDKLIKYKTSDKKKLFARDMWLLCYYCGGRNYIDLLKLKYENVSDTTITFNFREKTKETDDKQEPLIIEIDRELRTILNRHAQKNTGPETYVLNILSDNLDPKQTVDRRNDFGKDCNAALALISADLKIPAIKMQQSRHTAINEVIRRIGSIDEAQKMAGHATSKTTKGYAEMLSVGINKTVNVLRRGKLKAV